MIYQLKVTLKHTKIWRRLLVDEEMTFYQLHHLLQIAFDWEDCHLHRFTIKEIPEDILEELEKLEETQGHAFRYSDVAEIGDPSINDGMSDLFFDEIEEVLGKWMYLEKDSCNYTYDFGDDWEHLIVLEKILAPSLETQYPVCVKAKGEAPEEDSRGWFEEKRNDKGGHQSALQTIEDAKMMKNINLKIKRSGMEFNGIDFAKRLKEELSEAAIWHNLYSLADNYRKLAPWQWMGDIDIFAVSVAEAGEMGYCSVLGEAGEMFGLAVYKGNAGLKTLLQIMQSKIDDSTVIYEQRSVLLSLEDRKDLSDMDYIQIAVSGISFRGRKAYPAFRSFEPGHVPWHLTEQEAQWMCQVLEQAMIVAMQVKEHPQLLSGRTDERILCRTTKRKGKPTQWVEEWIHMEVPVEDKPEHALHISEIKLAGLKKKMKRSSAMWEFDLFFAPYNIQENEDDRPFFPRFVICMNAQSGLVMQHDVVGLGDVAAHLQLHIVKTMESVGILPEGILVQNDDVYRMIQPLCHVLKVELNVVNRLHGIHHFKEEMFTML